VKDDLSKKGVGQNSQALGFNNKKQPSEKSAQKNKHNK